MIRDDCDVTSLPSSLLIAKSSIPKTLIAVVYDDLSLSSLTLCDGQVDLEGAENIDDAVTCFGKQKPGENLE